jgi:cytochrome c oxidase subunit II
LFFLLGISSFFSMLIFVLIFYFAVKYRRRFPKERPAPAVGSMKLELTWTIIPLLICLFTFAWSAKVYLTMADVPANTMDVFVVGRQWMWKAQHMGGQREINELHVPLGKAVKLTLTSQDVIHNFSIPAFRVKQDVVPGRYVTMWFQATKKGKFHLFCGEYCGTNHSKMVGWVFVMEPSQFQDWLKKKADGSLVDEGRKVFQKYQCNACHTTDSPARAPLLEDLYGKNIPLQDGGFIPFTEDYIRESILRPDAKIVAGYRPIMPSFDGQVTEQELIQLIAFIKNLGRGQTPPRTEEGPPIIFSREPELQKKGRP